MKHIKGSSNCTADNLSRLPVCIDGGAEYPAGRLRQLGELPSIATININHILLEEEAIMQEVQGLAQQPQQEYVSVTISQVVGESSKEAWDILPMLPELHVRTKFLGNFIMQ